jgi:cell division control protein 24
MREIQTQSILSNTTSQLLFVNLNSLVDFQRRFLFRLESEVQNPLNSQHIGKVFIDMVSATTVILCMSFS